MRDRTPKGPLGAPSIARPCSVRVMQRVLPNYLSIYQVRDYQNDHKAFARDVLRFEIALEGVKFLRSLEYAPPDAALTIPAQTPPAPPNSSGTRHRRPQCRCRCLPRPRSANVVRVGQC